MDEMILWNLSRNPSFFTDSVELAETVAANLVRYEIGGRMR
jgi:hypothetical protein